MNNEMATIGTTELALAFIPVVIVIIIMFAWSLNVRQSVWAVSRMVLQLVVIGYLLVFIFEAEQSLVVILVLTVMLGAAGWISLNPLPEQRRALLPIAILSLAIGGIVTLFIITFGVLRLDPWFHPQYMVPLAGMTFANAMTTISLAAERYQTEIDRGAAPDEARATAMKTGMIPVINSLFAVGLVALPGMMTGQILSGVSPLIAVRYQIMIMCMMFGSSGISAACYLYMIARASSQTGNVRTHGSID